MQGLSGYGFKDLIGKPVGELIIPMCGSNGENRIVTPRMMENAEVPVLEARLHCKDGSVKEVSASVARVRYRNEPAVMAIIRDVTEQKKVERMKSNLIRDVSHSLKTPVALVRMAYEMCNRGIESQNLDRIRRSQRIAADNILKLQKDLNNILELFTLEGNRNPGAREECSLHEIINEIKREVDYLLNEKAISFETYVSGDAGSIRGIRREIKMLLYNIIENAIKFTVNGKITVTASRNDGAITLNVTDTGKGIDAEDMGRIFEKFYQSSAAVNGTGLGLAICKEIVERHNGTIRACSDGKGQGSRIEICVPVDLGERRETGFGD
jgi:two-component system sensor histidine kinase ResE